MAQVRVIEIYNIIKAGMVLLFYCTPAYQASDSSLL